MKTTANKFKMSPQACSKVANGSDIFLQTCSKVANCSDAFPQACSKVANGFDAFLQTCSKVANCSDAFPQTYSKVANCSDAFLQRKNQIMGTPKNPLRHAELVSASPAKNALNKGIAGHASATLSIQARNDENQTSPNPSKGGGLAPSLLERAGGEASGLLRSARNDEMQKIGFLEVPRYNNRNLITF